MSGLKNQTLKKFYRHDYSTSNLENAYFYCKTTQNKSRLIEYYSEMVIFEDWKENQFSKYNHDLESPINLADLYWQGSDLK